MDFQIRAFYKFTQIPDAQLSGLQSEIEAIAARHNTVGLVILGTEGINSTVAGRDIEPFITELSRLPLIGPLETKTSVADRAPFRRFKVVIREEIVTLGTPHLLPHGPHRHLPAEEWEKTLQEPDVVVIDTRNWYETQVGKFKNAVDLNINEFTEFPQAVEKLNLKKDQKVLMYCTGGIRCEKAILSMEQMGFENVFQLEGGILTYLEKMPHKSWEGECFVFDHRVAVDQELQPSKKYALCPHCGQPTATRLDCVRCDAPTAVCEPCLTKGPHMRTCSKNCAHHYEIKAVKGRHQVLESGTRRSLSPKKQKAAQPKPSN